MEEFNRLVDTIIENKNLIVEKSKDLTREDFNIQEDGSYEDRIKSLINVLEVVTNFVNEYNEIYGNFIQLINNDFNILINTEVGNLNREKLHKETDSPKKAYQNMQEYIAQFGNNDLLSSAMEWIKTQIPSEELVDVEISNNVAEELDTEVIVNE